MNRLFYIIDKFKCTIINESKNSKIFKGEIYIMIRKKAEEENIIFSKEHKQICNFYVKGLSSNEIAKRYNCKIKTIIAILDKHGIKRRDIKRKNNPNWKF